MDDGPLDMRVDKKSQITAHDIVNWYSLRDLSKIIRDLGGEEYASRIAKAIVMRRKISPISTTRELSRVIVDSKPSFASRIHPATQTFLALRIAVNDELSNLREGLLSSMKFLKSGGICLVVSFQPLEDHIVKCFVQANCHDWKEFYTPQSEEIAANPRSRSAKLRIFKKLVQ